MKKITHFDGEYWFLSNFYPWEIVDENGTSWKSTEHYYQAAKTNNLQEKEKIANAPFFKKDCIGLEKSVKSLGKTCTIIQNWNEKRLEVMEKALRLKFRSDNLMGEKLCKTEDAELIEGNNWGDKFFGVCNGEGENNLGKLLMKIRKEIQSDLGYVTKSTSRKIF